MFSFFIKKHFLVDQLQGLVDIHNHILPGIDDGAQTVEDSIAMINGFSEFGVTNFVCTPHVMHDLYANTPETIKKAHGLLTKQLKSERMVTIKVGYAAEYLIDEGFEKLVENQQILSLDGQYLLIEMSFVQAPLHFEDAVQKILDRKLYPILAHPERYNFITQRMDGYQKYKDIGLKFQVNLLSIAGYYGKDVQKNAMYLLQHKLVDFVASDVHKINQIDHLKQCKLTIKEVEILKPIIINTQYSFQ